MSHEREMSDKDYAELWKPHENLRKQLAAAEAECERLRERLQAICDAFQLCEEVASPLDRLQTETLKDRWRAYWAARAALEGKTP